MVMFKRTYFVLFSFVFILPSSNGYAQVEEPLIIEDVEGGAPSLESLETVDNIVSSDDGATISAPSVMADTDIDEDVFFDADDIVPQGEMARSGPVPVNPVTQPASKFITVTKNKSAGSKEAQFIAAERAMSLGRYDSALNILDVLYKKSPRDSRVVMGRATTLQKLGRFDEAMNMYERLADLEPNNIDVQVNMLGLLGTRYPSVALRRLIDLNARHQSHVGVMSQLAIAYAQAGDTQSALKYLGTVASIEPNNALHLFNMAVIADRSGRDSEAMKYYEKALEVDTIHGAGRTIPRDSVYQRLAQIR